MQPASPSDIQSLNRPQLRTLFTEHFGIAVAPRTSQLFLRGNLNWKQNAQAENLDRDFLDKLEKSLDRTLSGSTVGNYQTGTRLIREWHGTTYEVTVLDQGYTWQGKVYRSLSKVAAEITGTHQSGPKFFELKRSRK